MRPAEACLSASVPPLSVFLNIPYDASFERLYLAYISGITAFRLIRFTTCHECKSPEMLPESSLQYAVRAWPCGQLGNYQSSSAFLVRV